MFAARLDPLAYGSDWLISIQFQDEDTGDLLDLTGTTFTIALQKFRENMTSLKGSSSDGHITNPELGTVIVHFLGSETKDLAVGDYKVGLKAERNGFTETLVIGTLPVIEGVA